MVTSVSLVTQLPRQCVRRLSTKQIPVIIFARSSGGLGFVRLCFAPRLISNTIFGVSLEKRGERTRSLFPVNYLAPTNDILWPCCLLAASTIQLRAVANDCNRWRASAMNFSFLESVICCYTLQRKQRKNRTLAQRLARTQPHLATLRKEDSFCADKSTPLAFAKGSISGEA